MTRQHCRRGVSILELAAIAVILFVIAALVWPFGMEGKGDARKGACISNLKMTGLSLLMYASDWDDRLPPAATWATLIKPYAKNDAIMWCPVLENRQAGQFGHAFHRPLQGRKTTSEAQSEPMLFDSSDLSWSANGGLDLLPRGGRHRDGMNGIAFIDGHARLLSGPQLFDEYWASKTTSR